MLKFDAQGLIPAVVQDATTRQVLMVGYMNRESLRRTVESRQAWFWSRSRGELWHKGATSGNFLNVRTLRVDCDGDTLLVEADPVGPTCHTGAVSCFFNDLTADDRAELGAAPAPAAIPGPAARAVAAAELPVEVGPNAPEPDDLPLVPSAPPISESIGSHAGATGARDAAGITEGDSHPIEGLFAVIEQRQRERPEGSYVVKLLDGGIDRVAKKVGEEATEVVIAAKNGDASEITWEVADLWFHSLVLLAATGVPPAAIWAELERRRR
jgi:phosphoribosyl-AMP cyclohydrolase / phosphoribosyl-ATP pyrophosphohydrolase